MELSITLLVVAPLAAYAAWRLLRMLVQRSPLDNIPGPPSPSFFTGNMLQMMSHNNWEFMRGVVNTYGSAARLNDFFNRKFLLVYDTKAIHTIFVKEQEAFPRVHIVNTGGKLILGPGLLATIGDVHRRQRKMLNPVFSAAYMRGLTPFFYSIVAKLETAIEARVRAGTDSLDMIGWMGRVALELVGQGALGHSFDPLVEDSKDEFTRAIKSFIPSINEAQYTALVLPVLDYFPPGRGWRMVLDAWPDKNIQRLKRNVDLIFARSKEILQARQMALKDGGVDPDCAGEGKDVMSILLRANMSASDDDRLPDDEVLAQMATFVVAGVDTTSNAMARVLDILAHNPEAQTRLRTEILEARETCGKEIPFDDVMRLPYLDAVCRETLRLYTPINFISREAKRDSVLPLSQPIKGVDGTTMSEIVVPKGTQVWTYVPAINTDKAIWGEDALEWKPDRWLQAFPQSVEEARVPGIYTNQFTFGGGGYACIGFKFSQLEMKVVLSTLIATFQFDPSTKPYVWNSAGVAYPAPKYGDKDPEMFLKVSLACKDN